MFALAIALVLAVLIGCAGPQVRQPVPDALATKPWANEKPSSDYRDADSDSVSTLSLAIQGDAPVPRPAGRPQNVLCVSGGGKYAAFTAGALCGWTAAGTRPDFDVATGVSSGAPTAFMAFLGPKYDDELTRTFLNLNRSDLFRWRPVRGLITGRGLMTSRPLEDLLEKHLDDPVMADLCAAHAQGRRLFVATSNVLSRRVAIWDIGAIACSGRPDAKVIIRKVILAACSIPGLAPPVEFDVTVNGVRYQELHSDAGNLTQVFVRTAGPLAPGSNVWVLSAGKTHPNRAETCPGIFETMVTAVSTTLYALFRADTVKLYALCGTTRSRFGLIALPDDFQGRSSSMVFDPSESQRMYLVGYQMGKNGTWEPYPPDTAPGTVSPPRAGLEFTTGK
ncbi:patatin-like phospholipase family protein [Gemmata sp. G18]|uniref:Patatin-like phospholipase family protein n=1 Tax=Gemmata palustris TaxID=2822762 RepID=A0ABS5C011_9BACT|nr:patatin-like phospholipase family protein [Gemmata palustris]MBP3959220.1 patatin-like phospholipase family protein [Gemmata palustris]